MQVISASRRTDIPAFYTPWLLNRLRAGYCTVVNPFNRRVQVVPLGPAEVAALVFWTKNPAPLLPHLEAIRTGGYHCLSHYTLNAYGPELEPHLPPLEERVTTFRRLTELVGPAHVTWRYDPIVESTQWPWTWHLTQFRALAAALAGATQHCVVSFYQTYRAAQGRLRRLPELHGGWRCLVRGAGDPTPATPFSNSELRERLAQLAAIAGAHGMRLDICAPPPDLGAVPGVNAARCIDAEQVARLRGERFPLAARPSRPGCGCAASIDIGAYGTCAHGCQYCYAVQSPAAAARRRAMHDPAAAGLIV